MGKAVEQTEYSDEEYAFFSDKLQRNLAALDQVIRQPGFGVGEPTVGAELEMYLVDGDGRPLPQNRQVQSAANDPLLTLELNRYNLEYNLEPVAVRGKSLSSIHQRIETETNKLNQLLKRAGGSILYIGILPTLVSGDFGAPNMTDEPRYRALTRILTAMRKSPSYGIEISGEDPIRLVQEDITMEGANTSFQIHLRVKPDEYADIFNAIQLVSPLLVALSANSPFFLGHALWHETRIPLFKQAIDGRHYSRFQFQEPPRVNFGFGWVREGAYELFAHMVNLFRPLLPVCDSEEPLDSLQKGELPKLSELCLHNGTIWTWNRPIYDISDGGHLRVEMRSLPAGPTSVDMVANAALYIGLAEGMKNQLKAYIHELPFVYVEHNFYRAARFGLDARLNWPGKMDRGIRETRIADITSELLPIAWQGLDSLRVDRRDIKYYLGVIEQRLNTRQTGAVWQIKQYKRLLENNTKTEALSKMLQLYRQNALEDKPVASWAVE